MADGDKNAMRIEFLRFAGHDILEAHAGHGRAHGRLCFRAEDFVDHAVPDDRDVLARKQAVLHDLLRPETVAAMHDRHALGDMRKVKRFLDRGIAAADHDHILAAIEETVAGRAGRNAATHEGLLAVEAKPLGLCARRDDQGVAGIDRAGITLETERTHRRFDLGDDVVDNLGADILRLRRHLVHHPWPLHRIGIARIVFHVGGDHQLTALLQPGNHDWLQHGAGGINRRSITSRTRADDNDWRMTL